MAIHTPSPSWGQKRSDFTEGTRPLIGRSGRPRSATTTRRLGPSVVVDLSVGDGVMSGTEEPRVIEVGGAAV